VREAANRTQCTNNVKQIGLAVHSYAGVYGKVPQLCDFQPAAYNGTLSSANSRFPGVGVNSADGAVAGTWLVHLLPYLEQLPLFEQMQTPVASSTPPNYINTVYSTTSANPPYINGMQNIIKGFLCPSDSSYSANLGSGGYGYAWYIGQGGASNYAGNIMVLDPNNPLSLMNSMQDGTSNTVLIAERYQICIWPGHFTSPGWACVPLWDGASSITNEETVPGFGFSSYTGINPNATLAYPAVIYSPNFISSTSSPSSPTGSPLVPFQVMPPAATSTNVSSTLFCDGSITQTPHPAMIVGLGDASVRSVSGGISTTTWLNACLPNDGNPLGSDW